MLTCQLPTQTKKEKEILEQLDDHYSDGKQTAITSN